MEINKTKVKELFIAGGLNPAIAMMYRAAAVNDPILMARGIF